MSRQQKRADERKQKKTALQKICLAAGEGVGRAVAFSFALASNAFAAEPKNEETFDLPPVVVQDQNSPYIVPQSSLSKFPEPLKDTPQSITIIPDQLIKEQGGTTLRDALRNVPGIGITAGEGGGAQGDNLTLRGYNARNDIFLDGVRDQGTYFRDVFNLDSVEVLKGPSGLYFGRGSTGGVINQTSKTPRLDRSYGGALTGGSGALFRFTGDVNQPVSDNASIRLNMMAHKDEIAGRDLVENKRLGIAPSFAYGLGTPTQITLSYLFQKEDNFPDYGFPYFEGKPVRVDRDNSYGLANHDYERTWLNVGTLRLDHRFNDQFNIRNTTRYSQVHRQAAPSRPATTNGITFTRAITGRDLYERILSNQTDLTAKFETFSFKHTVVTGIEISREIIDRTNFTITGAPGGNLQNPNPDGSLAGTTRAISGTPYTKAIGFGIFATDQIKLNEYLEIVGGARFDYFGVDFRDKAATTPLDLSRIDRVGSYRGALVFHPTPAQSYYFSYATASNPSAEGLALANNNAATPPEKNQTFEVGAKIELLRGALMVQGAVFQIEKTNARTIDPDAPTGTLVTDGKQRVYGAEIGVTGSITPEWNVSASYTYLNPKITKSNDLQAGIPIEGKDPQNVPENSGNIWTTYNFLEKWQLGGGATFVGRRYANNSNTIRVPGYVRWDSTAAYTLNKYIDLRLNLINLTNQLYFDGVQGNRTIPGAGRTIMFTTNFKF